MIKEPLAGFLVLVFCAWPLYVGYVWYQWWKEDTPETTQKCICTMKCQLVVVCVFIALMVVLAIVAIANSGGVGLFFFVIIQGGIQFFFTWYYYNVTKRYLTLKHEA